MTYQRQSTSLRNGANQHNLTDIKFFYNTPLTDYQNTIHFESNEERDNHFVKNSHYKSINFSKRPFNFIRDRSQINVPISWQEAQGINYCTFISDFENKRYYAFVNEIRYVNDEVTELTLVIDVVMTFTQGNILEGLQNVRVERQHLPLQSYKDMLPTLRNNDDVLKANNKYYVQNLHEDFGENYVLWQSSADLRKPFGTKKKPNLDTSKGQIYDKINSPVDLYVMFYDDFNDFMDKMSEFSWITQNFQKIQLIPQKFIDPDDLEMVETEEDIVELGALMTLKSGSYSKRWTMDNLELSYGEILNLVDLNYPEYQHLLRNEYFTFELYSWNGDNLLLDGGKIPEDTGLKFNTRSIIGFHNELRVYPVHYNSSEVENVIRNENGNITVDKGAFLNQSMTFDSFAEVPILINNGQLQQAQRANQQKTAEDRLIGNRAKNIANPTSDLKSKFFDTVSIASNVTPMGLFSKFNEQYEHYNDKKAEYKDLALQSPTVTSSEMGNAFQIANNINGLTLKIGAPSPTDLVTIMKYYKHFGYEIDEYGATVEPINSMSICNHLKISGTYMIENIDTGLMEQLKTLLESGVTFWHNDGTANPLSQNVLNNQFVM